MRAAVAVAVGLIVAACGPSAPAAAPGANLNAKNLSATEGVIVTAGCTPTGPELCFNANDDNCNGVIDEGCGVNTGVLQFTIAWGDSPADVDISVLDPNAVRVSREKTSTPSGLTLEKNCPDDGCHQQNAENVYFDGDTPVPGRYIVEVKLVDPRGAELPVKVHLSARVGSRTWAMDLALQPGPGRTGRAFRSISDRRAGAKSRTSDGCRCSCAGCKGSQSGSFKKSSASPPMASSA